jgi:hypothetical protein
VNTLVQACADAQAHQAVPGWRIAFTLPIESQSSDQIKIDWNSTPLPPGHRTFGAKAVARKSARPGRGRKKAAKRSPKNARKGSGRKARKGAK